MDVHIGILMATCYWHIHWHMHWHMHWHAHICMVICLVYACACAFVYAVCMGICFGIRMGTLGCKGRGRASRAPALVYASHMCSIRVYPYVGMHMHDVLTKYMRRILIRTRRYKFPRAHACQPASYARYLQLYLLAYADSCVCIRAYIACNMMHMLYVRMRMLVHPYAYAGSCICTAPAIRGERLYAEIIKASSAA